MTKQIERGNINKWLIIIIGCFQISSTLSIIYTYPEAFEGSDLLEYLHRW